MPGVQRLTVDDDAAGQRLDNFVLARLKRLPRSRAYRMVRKGEVRVNGGRSAPTYRLQAGDEVRLPPWRDDGPEQSERTPSHRLRSLLEASICFEDDGLLVLDKPAGIAVHGGSGVDLGVIEALRAARDEPKLQLAHRLDRGTSGLLLIARRRSALNALQAIIRERAIRKQYELVVRGAWPAKLRSVRLPLLRTETAGGERRVRVSSDGKSARTDFSVLERGDSACLLRATLHTGRTHQIRVHCAHSGYPVLGDDKYDLKAESLQGMQRPQRLYLHACRLRFRWQDRDLDLRSATPESFLAQLNRSER